MNCLPVFLLFIWFVLKFLGVRMYAVGPYDVVSLPVVELFSQML